MSFVRPILVCLVQVWAIPPLNTAIMRKVGMWCENPWPLDIKAC